MFLLFISIIILSSLSQIVYSLQSPEIFVGPRMQEEFPISLAIGTRFNGKLSISGGFENDIDFWVTDPTNNNISSKERVIHSEEFEFVANKNGTYVLHFDNSFSDIIGKTVALTYTLENVVIFTATSASGNKNVTVYAGGNLKLTDKVYSVAHVTDQQWYFLLTSIVLGTIGVGVSVRIIIDTINWFIKKAGENEKYKKIRELTDNWKLRAIIGGAFLIFALVIICWLFTKAFITITG